MIQKVRPFRLANASPHRACWAGVAIYGHSNREETWFQVLTEAQKCDAAREHSICSNYVEFDEPEGENPVKFAHQTTLDMGRFQEFCQSSGATGG